MTELTEQYAPKKNHVRSKRPTLQHMIDTEITDIRLQFDADWRLSKHDIASPLLSGEMKEILIQGIREVVQSLSDIEEPKIAGRIFKYVELAKKRHGETPDKVSKKWADIITSSTTLHLLEQIQACPQMKEYAGDQKRASMDLLGTCVRFAIDIAKDLDISHEGVGWTFLRE